MITALATTETPMTTEAMTVHPVTVDPALDLPLIELVQPLPGFPHLFRFVLVEIDDAGVLCELRAVEDPDVRFLVVPPAPFFPDYVAEVADDVADALGAEQASDVLVLLVVTAGSTLAASTANLAAPVLVHVANRRGQQVLLDQQDLPLAAPLVAS